MSAYDTYRDEFTRIDDRMIEAAGKAVEKDFEELMQGVFPAYDSQKMELSAGSINYIGEPPKSKFDSVEKPLHYNSHPSGIECIQITEHMNFCLGNAMKYLWRAGLKNDEVEDLKKARWYLDREILRIEQCS